MSKYSQKFLAGVEHYEGFFPKRYKDPVGKWTIGIGHLLTPADSYTPSTILSHEEAVDLLISDLDDANKQLLRAWPAFMNIQENKREALISWVFNLGIGNFKDSTMFKQLLVGNYAAVPGEMKRWIYGTLPNGIRVVLPGLVLRRAWEANIFAAGDYTLVE